MVTMVHSGVFSAARGLLDVQRLPVGNVMFCVGVRKHHSFRVPRIWGWVGNNACAQMFAIFSAEKVECILKLAQNSRLKEHQRLCTRIDQIVRFRCTGMANGFARIRLNAFKCWRIQNKNSPIPFYRSFCVCCVGVLKQHHKEHCINVGFGHTGQFNHIERDWNGVPLLTRLPFLCAPKKKNNSKNHQLATIRCAIRLNIVLIPLQAPVFLQNISTEDFREPGCFIATCE